MKTARKSAPKTAKRAGKAKVKSARKSAAKRPSQAASPSLAAVVTTPAPELAQPRVFTHHDFRMSIDDMEPERLKAYARYLGITQRDVDGLTEDRLRQNCKARVFDSLEG